jgi:hypothetical protein
MPQPNKVGAVTTSRVQYDSYDWVRPLRPGKTVTVIIVEARLLHVGVLQLNYMCGMSLALARMTHWISTCANVLINFYP